MYAGFVFTGTVAAFINSPCGSGKPQLLLLDEITANLDTETEKAVLNALNNVCKDRTVISISHRVTAKTGRIIPVESNV